MNECRITVLMSVYNCEKTVRKSIDSILAQTYTGWKMAICDDGSTDGTWEILNEYKNRYPEKFIILKNETNRHVACSVNRCMEYIDTEYTARMDGDDFCSPKRFLRQIEFLDGHREYDLVGSAMNVFNGEKIVAVVTHKETPQKSDVVKTACFTNGSVLMRSDAFKALGGYNEDKDAVRVEDFEFWCRFYDAGYKGFNLSEPLYTFFEDAQSMKRRSAKACINGAKVSYKYIKRFKLPFWYLVFPLRRLLLAVTPKFIYRAVHTFKLKNNMGS